MDDLSTYQILGGDEENWPMPPADIGWGTWNDGEPRGKDAHQISPGVYQMYRPDKRYAENTVAFMNRQPNPPGSAWWQIISQEPDGGYILELIVDDYGYDPNEFGDRS